MPGLNHLIHLPVWFEDLIYPIDKTNLDVRFAHFLALAAVTVRFVPQTWPLLRSWALYPAILCGQHSLKSLFRHFLAFAGHFAMVEVSAVFGANPHQRIRYYNNDWDSSPNYVV